MGQAVKGTRRSYSVGSLTLYVQPLILVKDASIHTSSLNNVRGYWANSTSEAVSSIKAGCDMSSYNTASGVVVGFRMPDATNGKSIDLYLLSAELE